MMNYMAQSGTDATEVFRLKIELEEIEPPIWREVRVPGRIRLCALHDVIQITMGWTNSHLHSFEKDGREWSEPALDEFDELNHLDEKKARLSDLLLSPGDSMGYVYDWGDNWRHSVVLVRIEDGDADGLTPVCLGGERKCPPEDVGGPGGYEEFLRAIFDPKHKEHSEMLNWAGGYFQAEEFNLPRVNAALARKRWRATYLR